MQRRNFEFYRLNHQTDNLAKLWQEFLSVTELIAKIFGAVSRTKAQCGSRRCLHASDAVAAMTAFVHEKGTARTKPNVRIEIIEIKL